MHEGLNKFGAIFDMDGVLIDSNPYHKTSLRKFAKKYGYELSEQDLREKIYGRQNKEWLPQLFGRELDQDELENYGTEKELLFQKMFKKDIAPVNGLMPFLNELKENEVIRAIATSAPRINVDYLFDYTPIGKYFGLVLDASHVKRGKPDPEVYLKASELLGFEPQECVVFEDSLSGVESARRAGCKVIAVGTTHVPEEFEEVDLFIADFSELDLEKVNVLFNRIN